MKLLQKVHYQAYTMIKTFGRNLTERQNFLNVWPVCTPISPLARCVRNISPTLFR